MTNDGGWESGVRVPRRARLYPLVYDASMFRVWSWAATAAVFAVLAGGLAGTTVVPHPGFTSRGDLVLAVEPGTAGDAAGLHPGDRVVGLDGLRTRILETTPGSELPVTVERGGETLALRLVVRDPDAREQLRRWIQSLVGFSFALLGLAAARRRNDVVGRLFLGLTLGTALTLHAPLPWHGAGITSVVTLLEDLAQVLLGPVFLHFFLRFPEHSPRLTRARAAAVYAPAAALGVFAALDPFGVLPPALYDALPPLAGLYLAGCLIAALARFGWVFLRTRRPADRERLRVMLAGTACALVPLLLALLLPARVAAALRVGTWSPLLLTAIPLTYGYAIVRYRALDLEVSVRRRLALGLITAVALGAGTAAIAWVENRWDPERHSPWITAVAGGALAAGILWLHTSLRRWLDRLLAGDRDDFGQRVREYENRLATLLHEKRVRGSLLENVCRLFQVSTAGLYRFGEEHDRLVLVDARGPKPPAPTVFIPEPLRPLLRTLRRVVEPEELVEMAPEAMRPQLGERLDALGFAALAPLHEDDAAVGVLALGPPAGRSSFSRRERRALTRIAVRAASALHTARAHEDAVAQERLARDLEVAHGIQRRLLPDHAPTRLGTGFDAVTHACEAVGGDFYDYIDFADGRVGFAVGDVSGKGIGASLLMAAVHTALHTEAADGRSPGAVLRRVNLALIERKEQGRFVCLFYAVLSADGRELTYGNAGVEPPILVRRDGRAELLTEGGLVLGVTAGADYPEAKVILDPGDRLLVFSDGLLENEVPADVAEADTSADGDGLLPGYRRLISAAAAGSGGPREAIRRLLRSSGFAPDAPPPDDVTLLLVQRWG